MPTEIQKRKVAFSKAILSLEKRRKSRIFCFVQTENETICTPTYAMLFAERKRLKNIDTLELLIHSGGGHPEIAYKAAKFFRRHCKRLNVIVPMAAKSAATLMCLVADTIYMGELAELGPLDIQLHDPLEKGQRPFSPLNEFKSMEYLREHSTEILDYFTSLLLERSTMSVKEALHEAIPAVVGMMTPLYQHVNPSKIGEYRRSLAIGEEYATRILKYKGFRDSAGLAQKLTWEYPTHDFAIDYDEVKELGLPVLRLDTAQEELLLEAISGIIEYGVPAYGLIEAPKPKTTPARKRVRRPRKPKLSVPAPLRERTAAA